MRTRDSFILESCVMVGWLEEPEKYHLTRRHWTVYQSLLLFFHMNDLLLPELRTVIVRRAFALAIKTRINDAYLYGWRKAHLYGWRKAKYNEKMVSSRCFQMIRAHSRTDVKYDSIIDTVCGEKIGNTEGLLCTEESGATLFITDRFFNDDWMRDASNSTRVDELYRAYLWDTAKSISFFCVVFLFWLCDSFLVDYALSKRMASFAANLPVTNINGFYSPTGSVFECVDEFDCSLSVPFQLIFNPLWFIHRTWLQQPLFPSLVIANTTVVNNTILEMIGLYPLQTTLRCFIIGLADTLHAFIQFTFILVDIMTKCITYFLALF